MRYQRCHGLLAGQRAIANTAIGSGRTEEIRGEPRPDDGRTTWRRAARSSPAPLFGMAKLVVHLCSPRYVRVTIDAELNG